MSAPLTTENGPIVVAVDFSDDSRLALAWAARQAQLEGTTLLILHVVHDPAAAPGFYRQMDENWLRPMIDVAEDMLESFLTTAKTDYPNLPALTSAQVRLVSGLPARRITEVAEEANARLVVVGSRGRSGLDAILLGSVAERVVQISRCPVVIVKAPAYETSA